MAHQTGKEGDLQARLDEAGYDLDGLNAGAMMEVLVALTAIDRFLCFARGQLNATEGTWCSARPSMSGSRST